MLQYSSVHCDVRERPCGERGENGRRDQQDLASGSSQVVKEMRAGDNLIFYDGILFLLFVINTIAMTIFPTRLEKVLVARGGQFFAGNAFTWYITCLTLTTWWENNFLSCQKMQKIPNCRQSICLCRAELHFLQFVDLAKTLSNDDQVTLEHLTKSKRDSRGK